MGYGGAWVKPTFNTVWWGGGLGGGVGLVGPTALFFWPFTNRHVTLFPRPTPGLKLMPQGATPQPKPTRGGALSVFLQPKPHTPWPADRKNSTKHNLLRVQKY
ncbi:hypothetical protein Hanom_Chr13g01241611 [Helianthus anomalus]